MYAPSESARLLGIAPGTLRKWSVEFAASLSPEAANGSATGRRRYTANDIATLRHASALLRQNATYEQVREQLAELRAALPPEPPSDDAYIPDETTVTVIEPSDQAAALVQLVEAQRQIIASQRQHIEAQERLVDQLQHDAEQIRQQSEGDRASLLAQMKQQRDQSMQDKADLMMVLQRAKVDEAAALADLRRMIDKIPRWLRSLLGLGV